MGYSSKATGSPPLSGPMGVPHNHAGSPGDEWNEIAESISDRIIEVDAASRVLYVNRAVERSTGRSRADLLGKPYSEAFPDARGALVEDALHRCITECTAVSIETLDQPTGVWYEIRLTPRREGGAIVCFSDISARKALTEQARAMEAAGRELRLREERLRVALRGSGVFVWQQDSELRYTWQSSSASGRPQPDMIGKTDADLFPPEDAARLMEIERAVIRTGQGARGEISLGQAGRRRDFLYNLEPLRDNDGRIAGLTGASVDITEQKAREEGLRDRKKLEAIGMLAAGIAHDFNNLLVGIIGNASLAANLLPAGSPVRPLLEGVMSSGERAADLTRQILAFSGQGRVMVERINLSVMVEQVQALLRSCLRERTRLALDLDPELRAIEADPAQIQQLLTNLVINAAEAVGPALGTVMLRTRNVSATAAELRKAMCSSDLAPGPYVCLEVRDTGQGMDEQTRTRVFEPFFTTKEMGRGLGLPAALGIVLGHKGAIAVNSRPNRGTTVRVLFPPAA